MTDVHRDDRRLLPDLSVSGVEGEGWGEDEEKGRTRTRLRTRRRTRMMTG